MRLLLDTHAALWATTDSSRLPKRISETILDPQNEIFVSAVSIWEIAIKYRLGKASAPPFSGTRATAIFAAAGYGLLAVTGLHAAAIDQLDMAHADPFDRLILAQALTEPMRLVTHDRQLSAYSDTVMTW